MPTWLYNQDLAKFPLNCHSNYFFKEFLRILTAYLKKKNPNISEGTSDEGLESHAKFGYSAIYTDDQKRADYVDWGAVVEDNIHGYRLNTSTLQRSMTSSSMLCSRHHEPTAQQEVPV
ncbi:hypothetical protein TNCV_3100571 [Trichonephila clavipes]|nr:hypothetical protein TNCV_3100571 [Trichonephila clavipes]